MRLSWKLCGRLGIVGLSLGLAVQLEASESNLRREGNPFPISDLSDQEIRTVAMGIGYSPPDGPAQGGRCIGCHSNFNNREELNRLSYKTEEAYSCFDGYADHSRTGAEVMSCLAQLPLETQTLEPDVLQLKAKDLGFMAAGVNHLIFQQLFREVGREADWETFKNQTRMPLRQAALPDPDFEQLLSWVLHHYPNLNEYIQFQGPAICQQPEDSFVGSQVQAYLRRMNEGGLNWWLANQARGVTMFACPSLDPHQCFMQQKNSKDVFPLMDSWKNPNLAGHIRLLHQYEESTNYWIRASADGRFVANGGFPSAIIDLQAKLLNNQDRRILVDAAYDPAFFPDNSGFMFQQGTHGSSVCEQSVLTDPLLTHLDFNQPGCAANDMHIGLYQSIGNSLQSGDLFTLAGDFDSDSGYSKNSDQVPVFEKNSSLDMATLRRIEAGRFEKIASRRVTTPYHGNWMMSPANQLAIAVVTAAKDRHPIHGGYRLFLLDENFGKNGSLPSFGDASTAQICTGGGEKPNISFDERFLAWYRYNSKDSGVESEEASADIWIFDLLQGKEPIRVTQMPKGSYAQFPHFRSDGWLYFSVYDAVQDTRFVAATDVSVYFKDMGIQP